MQFGSILLIVPTAFPVDALEKITSEESANAGLAIELKDIDFPLQAAAQDLLGFLQVEVDLKVEPKVGSHVEIFG